MALINVGGGNHARGMEEVRWRGVTLQRVWEEVPDPLVPDTDMQTLAVTIGQPLSGRQADLLAGLTGYVWRAVLNGHRLVYDHDHEHPGLIVFDGVAGPRRSDPAQAWARFLRELNICVREGTPIRTTDRAGAGTKGTRLLDGFGPGTTVEVYADKAVPHASAVFLQAMSGIPARH